MAIFGKALFGKAGKAPVVRDAATAAGAVEVRINQACAKEDEHMHDKDKTPVPRFSASVEAQANWQKARSKARIWNAMVGLLDEVRRKRKEEPDMVRMGSHESELWTQWSP